MVSKLSSKQTPFARGVDKILYTLRETGEKIQHVHAPHSLNYSTRGTRSRANYDHTSKKAERFVFLSVAKNHAMSMAASRSFQNSKFGTNPPKTNTNKYLNTWCYLCCRCSTCTEASSVWSVGLISLTAAGHQRSHLLQCCHSACGHEGSSHLSPVLALRVFIGMQVQHSYSSSSGEIYVLAFLLFPLRKRE